MSLSRETVAERLWNAAYRRQPWVTMQARGEVRHMLAMADAVLELLAAAEARGREEALREATACLTDRTKYGDLWVPVNVAYDRIRALAAAAPETEKSG
jgi:hypothetical protein